MASSTSPLLNSTIFAMRNIGSSASSMAQTMLVFNLAALATQLPSSLYHLLLRVKSYLFRQVHITVPEQGREWYLTNPTFSSVETYLQSLASDRASRLRAATDRSGRNLLLTLDDSESMPDSFTTSQHSKQIMLQWRYFCRPVDKHRGTNGNNEKKYYTLTFNARHRPAVIKEYLKLVADTSREIELRNRRQKLYTNSMGKDERLWTGVNFSHPATFDTLAMDADKKREIMEDLEKFSKSQEYYKKIGKAWKRGYLLYGPPGTGKSTMIAAMANFLDYDVYDLELTAVSNNTELRRLVINTTNKSIIVVEDIDCTLEVVNAREKAKTKKGKGKEKKESKVTLSGLFNFIDGLWSACSGERLVVFTTNHVDKLDPALIRKGRMDVHVELSYCGFEGFKVLAKNYLGVDEHPMFERVEELLKEVEITTADVAEQLMPKRVGDGEVEERCLGELVRVLEMIRRKKNEGEEVEVDGCSSVDENVDEGSEESG